MQMVKACAHQDQRPMSHPGPGVSQPKWPPMASQAGSSRKRMQQPNVHASAREDEISR